MACPTGAPSPSEVLLARRKLCSLLGRDEAAFVSELASHDEAPRKPGLKPWVEDASRPVQAPCFDTHEMETPSPLNPLGVKGVGESGTVVATPALRAAVLDALAPFGVTTFDLPATPERVWRAING